MDTMQAFVETLKVSRKKSHRIGDNVRAEGPFVSGAALVYGETVLHLSAFAHEGKIDAVSKVPYQRFSKRRRGF